MDNKNIIAAISLSMAVLIIWSFVFEPPKPNNITNNKENNTNEEIITPNINEDLKANLVSREESLKSSKRIKIENNNIIGSLSLTGAVVDDISFKNHKQDLEEGKNVEFLNPAESENGFYVETGWTSLKNKINVPSRQTIWTIKGNNILSENQPILLEWNNKNGIIFQKKNRT